MEKKSYDNHLLIFNTFYCTKFASFIYKSQEIQLGYLNIKIK